MAFPEKTVRARLSDPVTLALPEGFGRADALADARLTTAGWLVSSGRGVGLFAPLDGSLVALWPPGVADEGWLELPLPPLLFADRVEALDPTGVMLSTLDPLTLAPRARVTLAELALPLDAEGRRVLSWGKGSGGELVLWLAGSREGRLTHVVAVRLANGEIAQSILCDHDTEARTWTCLPELLVGVSKDALLVIKRQAPDERRVLALDGGAYDRIEPAPNGRAVAVVGEGGEHLNLFAVEQGRLVPRLAGCYIIPGPNHNGGWVFWDEGTPTHIQLMPTPFWRPRLLWDTNGAWLLFGDAQGLTALIDGEAFRGVKIMAPPGMGVWPLAFEGPDRLAFLNAQQAGRLVLDWRFGEPASVVPTPPPVAPEVPPEAPHLHRHAWLYALAAVAVGIAGAVWIVFKLKHHWH